MRWCSKGEDDRAAGTRARCGRRGLSCSARAVRSVAVGTPSKRRNQSPEQIPRGPDGSQPRRTSNTRSSLPPSPDPPAQLADSPSSWSAPVSPRSRGPPRAGMTVRGVLQGVTVSSAETETGKGETHGERCTPDSTACLAVSSWSLLFAPPPTSSPFPPGPHLPQAVVAHRSVEEVEEVRAEEGGKAVAKVVGYRGR